MKDYYKILNIEKSVTEEELYRLLKKRIKYSKKVIENAATKEKIAAGLVIILCENFMKTLEHYGSKEKYDRALSINYNKKVNVNKNFDFNKKLALALAATVTIGTGIFALVTLDTTDIQVYTGETLDDICTEYNIGKIEILGDEFKDKDYTFESDSNLTVVSTNEKIEAIDELKVQKEEEKQIEIETYGFYYIVKSGDTASELKENLKLSDTPPRNLYQGDKIWLETTDPNIADKMKMQYEIDTAAPEPTNYEYYEVQPGDTLGTISEKFGVTPQILVKFNNISNGEIYAGQKVIIVYEYVTGARC